MNKNNFEKQVSQQLNALRIEPGEDSWNAIEQQLVNDRKKRRGIFFILLFAAILGGATFVWLVPKYVTTTTNQSVRTQKKTDLNTEQSKSAIGSAPEQQKNITLSGSTPENNISTGNQTKEPAKKTGRGFIKTEQAHHPEKYFAPADAEISLREEPATKILNSIPAAKYIILPELFSIHSPVLTATDTLSEHSLPQSFHGNPDQQLKLPEKKADKNSNQFPRKWTLGLNAGAGIFKMGNSFLKHEPSNYYSDNLSTPSPGVSVPQISIKNTVLFNIGLEMEKNFSRRSSLSIGATYNVYNYAILKQTPGSPDREEKNNQLHYLTIPLSFKYLLNKKGLPVSWSAAIIPGYLVNTNAWQFNYTGFYRDNSQFKKTGIGLQTGVFAEVLSNKNLSLRIGPYIHYDATKLSTEGIYKNKHLTTIGLKTEISFK